jgi:anti-sigma B factor antagonist
VNAARRLIGDVMVLNLSGHMAGLDAPGVMKERVTAALAAGHLRIVLNLSQVSFADSSFIGELVTCFLRASRAGGTLKVACPVRRVKELLTITQLGTVIESFDSESAAIDSFSRPAH